jgi:hypothetical protein
MTIKTMPKKDAAAAAQLKELGQVPVSMVPLARLRPAPENDTLYKPLSTDDPEVVELAASIRREGLIEPLLSTADYYLLSGHKRYWGCKRLGRREVPCRVAPGLYHDDSRFLRLLREANRQRVKTVAEVAREEVVSADPEEAHRLLVAHRKKVSAVDIDIETIELKDARKRCKISKAKEPFLEACLAVLRARHDYWPLTVRQIHYALLNDPPLIHASKPGSAYTNTHTAYKALDDLLTRARLEYEYPFLWGAIDDATRPMTTWNVWQSTGPFIKGQLDDFLKNYYRDLLQSQPNQIEVIGEKNTILNIIEPVLMDYCIPFTIGRGYSSLPPRMKMAQRYFKSGKEQLILLAVSDFDPEGEDIAESYARSMRDDFGIDNIVPIKVALTHDQVTDPEMGLHPQMKAKAGSSRRQGFVEKYGDDVFELEAIPPAELQVILRQVIDSVLDVDAFNTEVDAEKKDAAELDKIRKHLAERFDIKTDDSEAE